MASRKLTAPARRTKDGSPGDGVGIQVPVGRILANRIHWQTVLLAPDKPSIYSMFNAGPRPPQGRGNSMLAEVNGAEGHLGVDPGSSLDVLARRIRVRAGNGGAAHTVDGWYVLVS